MGACSGKGKEAPPAKHKVPSSGGQTRAESDNNPRESDDTQEDAVAEYPEESDPRATEQDDNGQTNGHDPEPQQQQRVRVARVAADGTYEVTLQPKVPLGFLRRAKDQVVISHTVEASQTVIANIQVGDMLVGIQGTPTPQDPDFVNIMLISMRDGRKPFKLKFRRQDLEDPPTLVSPPDFFDDPVEWFAYWDYDLSGAITLDDMIHALSFSLRLPENQVKNLRRGMVVWWPKWDLTGLGMDLLTFISPEGLAPIMLNPVFFELLEGTLFESDVDSERQGDSDAELLNFRFEQFISGDGAPAAVADSTATNGEKSAPDTGDPEAQKKADKKKRDEEERLEKARQQIVKILQNAISTRNVETMEKQLDHWKANPDGAPTELIAQAQKICAEEAEAKKKARAKELEDILNFASENLRGRAGLARMEKALEQARNVPDFDASKWQKMYDKANERIGSILKACEERGNKAKEFVKTKSEDLDAMTELKNSLESALKAAAAAELGEDIRDADAARKKLHNRIQDVRGGTRVFCRVRPLGSDEGKEVCIKKNLMELQVKDEANDKDETFQFDAIFDKNDGQAEVFVDCEDLVVSALDGYNITIFAYGQTGAGKTHSMSGTKKDPGVIPRTVEAIYKQIAENPLIEVEVTGRMVELYNNKVLDLLTTKSDTSKDGPKIRYDSKNNEVVLDPAPTSLVCKTVADMEKLIESGSANRRTACTMMNSDSSRSHLFIVLYLKCTTKDSGRVTTGKVTLIDLAGSERLKKSHVSGQGEKEAIEINKSLSALGDVISGLTSGKKKAEIPYRNHKLTQMLQDALGGTSKTVMFVCTRPDDGNVEETLMSLKYAQRARNIVNTKQKP